MPEIRGGVGRRRNERGARGSGHPGRGRRRRVTLVAVVVTAVAGSGLGLAAPAAAAGACTITWNAGAIGDWTTAANWSPAAVPGSSGRTTDEVCIPAGATVLLDNGPTGTSGPFTVAGINTTPDAPVSPGALSTKAFAPGTLTVSGTSGLTSRLGALSLAGGGAVTLAAGAVMTASSVSMPAGSLTVNGSLGVGGTVAISSGASGSGFLAGNGTLSVSGALTIDGGNVSAGGLQLIQGASTTASISSSGAGPTPNPSIFGLLLSTQSPLSISGQPFVAPSSTVTTSDQLTLLPGTVVQGSGSVGARGVTTTAGVAASVAPRLVITGATSDLGGDLVSGGLAVAPTATLTIPAQRTVTVSESAGVATSAGTITGGGALALTSNASQSVTGTLSVATMTMTGGQLSTQVGAVVSPGAVSITGGQWNIYAPVSVGAGGMTLGSTASTQGALAGTGGSIAVAGPWTQSGGRSDNNTTLTITQGPGTTATFSGATSLKKALLYNTSFSTQSPVTVTGFVEGGGTSLTTTSTLALGSGVEVTKAGPLPQTFTAAGVTTTGTAPTLAQTTLKITGSSSALTTDLSAAALEVLSGGSLFVPEGRTVNATAGSVTVASGATLGGLGNVAAHVQVAGTVSPGDSAGGAGVGTLTVARYTQSAGGVLDIDVSSSSNDRVVASTITPGATSTIAGTVAIARVGGYEPPVGAQLTVLAASVPPTVSSVVTTDDLPDGKFSAPSVVGDAVVVSRGPLTTTAPSAPTLSLTPGVLSISATVGAPASDGGSPITAYVVTCSPACGTNELAAPGLVTLSGLTEGVSYTVSAIARNAVGDSSATTALATPLAPTTTATPTKSKLVLSSTATTGRFTVSCTRTSGLITACSVVAKASNGTVLGKGGPVTVPAGATSIPVTVTLTSAGLSASKAFGGVRATVTSTVTPQTGPVATATSTIQIVRATTKQPVLIGSLFSSGGTLTSSGKTYLTGIAKKAAGGKVLRCDGYWSKNVSKTSAYKLGLDRATKVCAFVKSTITRLKLKPIGKYVVYSYGLTKQVSGTTTKNRRLVLTLSS